ncbi:MAG: hypothetical protein IKY52_03415 [Clostridia bacterium]|nr:hypothetical protein [Clostridia bacterium]
MSSYIQSILITMALSHLLLVLASELWGEHTQKLLRMLCGTVMLLTIFSPVKDVSAALGNTITKFLTETEITETKENLSMRTDAVWEASCSYIAEEWLEYLTERYSVDRSQIRLVFQTDENMRILSAEIILRDCPYALRRKIEQEMRLQTDIPITAKGA